MSGRSEKRSKSIRHCFYDFCKQTILHGWHYLVEGEVTTTSSGANTSSHFGSASPAACRSNQRRTSRDHNCCSCCCRCTCHRGHHNRAYNNGDGGRPQKPQCTNNRFLKCSQGINWAQRFRSAFWTLIVLASVVSGAFFLHNNTNEFVNSTVQTTLDGSVPLSEVFFPSVVVCNINQIRKSFFAELGFYENDTLVRIMYEDFIKGTKDMSEDQETRNGYVGLESPGSDPKRAAFYDVLKTYLEKRNLTVEGSITWLSHQKCDDMFLYSKWNGTTTYGFGNNERDFGTDYGICCWYTPQLNFSAIPDGPDTDWAFWFNSVEKESFDYGYYDEGSEGLKVAVVHHLDMPIIRQRAFHVAPGTENQIPVTPTLYTATPQALERFTPAERDCYKETEIDLMYLPKSHGYRYEMSNCLFEAAYEKILERCHCAPGFHNEGGAAAYERYPVCQGKQLTCSNNILNRMGEFNEVQDIIENKTKVCLTNCEDQINDLFVTTSNYPNKKTFKERQEFCLLLKKLIVTCQSDKRLPLSSEYPDLCPTLALLPSTDLLCGQSNKRWRAEKLNNKTLARTVELEVFNYARENLAIINIFIKESYTKRFRKTEKMSRISYIASSGGLLGLCMGFSFVSLAEIAYHCFLCCSILVRKKSVKFFHDNHSDNRRRFESVQIEANGLTTSSPAQASSALASASTTRVGYRTGTVL